MRILSCRTPLADEVKDDGYIRIIYNRGYSSYERIKDWRKNSR